MPASNDSDDVLSRLPRNRPARRSARRAPAGVGGAPTEASAAPAAGARRAASARKAAPAARPPGAAKSGAAAAQSSAAAKPRAAEPSRPAASPPPESARGPVEPPTGGEILHSAVQAATDLAAVGIAVGREAAKAVLRRLPRP
ncbi:MAG: hypothetical protein U0S48_10845 [Solirubrobacteraceae bacterium]